MLLGSGVAWLAFTPHPPPEASVGWDKANHAFAFASMALVAWKAWPGWGFPRIATAMLGYGVLIELVQAYVPGRSSEAADMLADAAGLLVAWALSRLFRRRPNP
ncbi:VanZ family protein [Rubrivivax gelatinosus]|uniref:VanZ-like domain-containing protein n=1 Tax=Rubrivivax gelatinosus (strain NBRC 100245 / IL144) TaxID=983917 RepID=I0HQ82_RUBGI|nr:VanZ family protein [Rubrivivax gelatinosus]BAL95169.1 hypothetical protein RGE_18280 [Rubrivivax gelatinosus IL144]